MDLRVTVNTNKPFMKTRKMILLCFIETNSDSCPASTIYCRPIKIKFTKESSDVSKAEKNQIDGQIRNLHPTEIHHLNRIKHIRHKLVFSMVDGKVCNAISKTISSQKCYLCDATYKMFNNIDGIIDGDV